MAIDVLLGGIIEAVIMDGLVRAHVTSGDQDWWLSMPIAKYRASIARGQRMLAEFDATHGVVQIGVRSGH